MKTRLVNSLPVAGALLFAAATVAWPEPAAAAFKLISNTDPAKTGLNDIKDILVRVIQFLLAFAAAIGALFIVISGYQYVLSAGNPEKVEKAKGGLTWAIMGFILTLSAFAIVTLLQDVLGSRRTVSQSVNGNFGVPADASNIIPNLIDTLLKFAGVAAVLFIIIGGYRMITSSGNPDQQKAARQTLLYAVIGLVVVMASYAIFWTVAKQIGGTNI